MIVKLMITDILVTSCGKILFVMLLHTHATTDSHIRPVLHERYNKKTAMSVYCCPELQETKPF